MNNEKLEVPICLNLKILIKNKMKKILVLITILFTLKRLFPSNAYSKDTKDTSTTKKESPKKQVNISADLLQGGKDDEGIAYKRLEGNVIVTLDHITIYADNATYYDDTKKIVAEGNIKILHDDGTEIVADSLIYDDETKTAELQGNIFCQSEKATFTTNSLLYNTKTQKGHFRDGGRLIEGENTLTSENGYYDRKNELALFENSVTLSNNDYTMYTESLKYSNITKIAKFKGFTQIMSTDGKKSFTTYKGGEYNTKKDFAIFSNGTIETDKFSISADVITADQQQEVYKITGNIIITAKEDNVTLTGEYGSYNKKAGIAEIFGNTLMTKQLDSDPLYLCADRFCAVENEKKDAYTEGNTKIEVHAYDNVKIYKSDIQGKAGSMVYKESESRIYVEGNPVFWNHQNQITADSAQIILQDKALHQIHMAPNSFLVFKDNMNNYNQLCSNSLKIRFTENKITDMFMEGNVEVIYFAVDKKKLLGLNVLKCGEILINLEEDDINKIDFPIKAQGQFYPNGHIKDEMKWLKNFVWREEERPTMNDVIYGGFGSNQQFSEFKFLK